MTKGPPECAAKDQCSNVKDDFVCSYCQRSLPSIPFPIPLDKPLPIKFCLPKREDISSTEIRNIIKENGKKISKESCSARTNKPANDTLFRGLREKENQDGSRLSLNAANGSQMLNSDENNELLFRKLQSVNRKLSRQSTVQLTENYSGFFPEFLGTPAQPNVLETDDQSPSERKYREIIVKKARQANSVIPFVKIAYPDYVGPTAVCHQEIVKCEETNRDFISCELHRACSEKRFAARIVYNLDELVTQPSSSFPNNVLTNGDENRIGKVDKAFDHLLFESRFEGGNLRRATQVGPNHYELILSPDTNQSRFHYQWFYFEVSNNLANMNYTFEIVNCLKSDSMFAQGMQPVVYSVIESCSNHTGWTRQGTSVCHYRNLYRCSSSEIQVTSNKKSRKRSKKGGSRVFSQDGSSRFYSIRFNILLRHYGDVTYVAYHYPYTYSFLRATIEFTLQNEQSSSMYFCSEDLCTTLGGNPVPLLTVTANGSCEEIANRHIIVLSARIHPGESNSSWVMQGVLEHLSGPAESAHKLRQLFIFKLLPMLNPDGVINGNHRCSLAGVDLNRTWDHPSEILHPAVYHSKGLLQYMVDILKKPPFVFIDFHGHSKRFNVFLYGNNPEESWLPLDHSIHHNFEFTILPELLSKLSPAFSLSDCRYTISKSKEPSARVVLWRQFGLRKAYTLESTYCGFEFGPYTGLQVGVSELKEMGRDLCEALLLLADRESTTSFFDSTA